MFRACSSTNRQAQEIENLDRVSDFQHPFITQVENFIFFLYTSSVRPKKNIILARFQTSQTFFLNLNKFIGNNINIYIPPIRFAMKIYFIINIMLLI